MRVQRTRNNVRGGVGCIFNEKPLYKTQYNRQMRLRAQYGRRSLRALSLRLLRRCAQREQHRGGLQEVSMQVRRSRLRANRRRSLVPQLSRRVCSRKAFIDRSVVTSGRVLILHEIELSDGSGMCLWFRRRNGDKIIDSVVGWTVSGSVPENAPWMWRLFCLWLSVEELGKNIVDY